MTEKICVHVFASGRVQGVNYRWHTLDTATSLSLKGWVRNLPDGRVEAEVEGEKETVNQLLEAMRKGPRLAQVTDLDVTEQTFEDKYHDFRVR